jgi:hypothetical protein
MAEQLAASEEVLSSVSKYLLWKYLVDVDLWLRVMKRWKMFYSN